jgi:hypothetical protein
MKKLIIIALVLLCGALILSCPGDSPPPVDTAPSDWYEGWVWEITDDKNPNKFAPGISILDEDCYVIHLDEEGLPKKYSQAYVFETPYVRNEPNTGWYKKITEAGWTRVETEDARGYSPTPSLPIPDEALVWPNNRGAGELVPMKQPRYVTVTGPSGADVEAIHLSGTMIQKGSESEDSDAWVPRYGNATTGTGSGVGAINTRPITRADDYRLSAGWPVIALTATPPNADEDPTQKIRNLFMDGYGYTFWVKPMKDFRSYRTGVENWDYRPNEGHEPGYWYGSTPGRDGTIGTNFTPAPVGAWTQVKVIYDPHHPDFNMAVNNWIYSYDITTNYPGDRQPYDIMENHDKDHSIRINFSFQLQHNGGNEGEGGVEYSVSTGRHEYDVYIYGLEILKY